MRYLRCTHRETGERRVFLDPRRAERVLAREPGGLDAWQIDSAYDPAWQLDCGHPDGAGRLPDHPDYEPSRREKKRWERYFPDRPKESARWWGIR